MFRIPTFHKDINVMSTIWVSSTLLLSITLYRSKQVCKANLYDVGMVTIDKRQSQHHPRLFNLPLLAARVFLAHLFCTISTFVNMKVTVINGKYIKSYLYYVMGKCLCVIVLYRYKKKKAEEL